ncbi:MAG TPA: DUF4124 domain-containing protein [Janthinobacterium sp.]|jgi:hypothetical protein|nr:DUF4124 domain-containing protein [Janthinobacterium sp.]
MKRRNKKQSNWMGRLLLAGALMGAAALAHAQYVWTDDKGLKVFSDRPPPPSVPLKNILKAPGLDKLQAQAADGGTDSAPAPGGAADKQPPSVAEQEAAYRKRKADEAAKDQKAAAEAKRKSDIASNCENMRKDQAMLQSGTRIGTITDSGERAYMNDEERAAKLDKIAQSLANCN